MVTTMRSALLDLASNLSNEGNMAMMGQQPIPEGMTKEAYVADRFKKARHILDLMMEKLPVSICPFAIQMGEQVATVYYNLGKLSGDDTCIEKSNKILEDEIMRYGQYLRFFQTLDASQYESLTAAEKFIDQQYVTNMLSDYGSQNGDEKYEALVKKLIASGVNMERLQAYQQAYERTMQQRAMQQAAAQAQAAEGTDEESSEALNSMLGN